MEKTIELSAEDKKFIDHMEKEMDWNDGRLNKELDGTFSYVCLPGSPVNKELKEAAKLIGVKLKIDKIDDEYYELTIK